MQHTQHTKTGIKKVTLTQSQLLKEAADGDVQARTEICKQELAAASTLQDEVDAIKKCLGVN